MLTSYPVLDCGFSNLFCPSADRQPPSPWPACPFWWTEPDFCSVRAEKKPKMEVDPEEDLRVLAENELKLRLSGYYYGYMSWLEASHLLKKSQVGTFLVRDSEHASYLYSLSVRTARGPTSCRIEYEKGRFRLDASAELVSRMPRFESVPDLVDHYIQMSQNLPKKGAPVSPVWVESGSNADVPVQIYKPLYKGMHSLQHLCRLSLIRTQRQEHPFVPLTRTVQRSGLPTVLKDYLLEYPYPQ